MWAGITGVIVGMLIGAGGMWLWARTRSAGPEELARLKRENAKFRDQVNGHFVHTAELINQLTDSYKAVFDHLSDGAETLVDPEALRALMPQVSDEEIRLKRIGAPPAPGQRRRDDLAHDTLRAPRAD